MAPDSITQERTEGDTATGLDYDSIVIGAGISGLYQLYRLRQQGQRVKVFEMSTGVGGTWYWNRYPGCRFDSESYSYGYSWSQEILDEWDWTEHFSPQPETEKYLNFVADKFDLRKDIQFSARVAKAYYQDDSRSWKVTLDDGTEHTSRFLVTAIGPLSAPVFPRIEGRDSFKGEAYHTGLWPKHEVSFEGKRVAVIGTGAESKPDGDVTTQHHTPLPVSSNTWKNGVDTLKSETLSAPEGSSCCVSSSSSSP